MDKAEPTLPEGTRLHVSGPNLKPMAFNQLPQSDREAIADFARFLKAKDEARKARARGSQ